LKKEEQKNWMRICQNSNNNPKCKKEIFYKNKKILDDAIKKNTLCKSCCEYHEKNHKYIKIRIFKRTCPSCGKEIIYNNIKSYRNSLRKNKKCRSCSQRCKTIFRKTIEKMKISQIKRWKNLEERQKQSKRTSGKNNPMYKRGYLLEGKYNGMYNKSIKDIWIKRYGKERAKEMWKEYCKKQKLITINRKINNGNFGWPNYNKNVCDIIDWINMYYDLNFQHALNGGEVYLNKLGYFLDAYDIKRNIIIEFYEKRHYDKNGNLKQKELEREQEIIKLLKCEFIRINAFDKNNLILEKII